MTESIYKEFENKYYNPDDNDKRPGDNDNWKSIQEGFSKISTTQLETTEGLTLGKGTEDETSVTAAELAQLKGGKIADFFVIGTTGSEISETIAANTTTEKVLFTNSEFKRAIPSNASGIYTIGVIGSVDNHNNYLQIPPVRVYTKLNNIPSNNNIPITNGVISKPFENVIGNIYFTNNSGAESSILPYRYIVIACRVI